MKQRLCIVNGNRTRGEILVLVLCFCFVFVSIAQAQLDDFAAQIHDRMWLDIQHYWDDEGAAAVAARRALHDQAQQDLIDGFNEILSGHNLDPGQRYVWRCSGVGGLRLDYPRPDFPEIAITAVQYWRPIPETTVFVVDWNVHWQALSHATHNGPYIHFRITGGWSTWTRRDDVRVAIDRMDMRMQGSTWYVVNEGTVSVRHFSVRPSSPSNLLDTNYTIEYTNPNRVGSEHRVGNRIIDEVESTYGQQMKFLVYATLLKDFVTWRLGEEGRIAANDDGFWTRQVQWVDQEDDPYGIYHVP